MHPLLRCNSWHDDDDDDDDDDYYDLSYEGRSEINASYFIMLAHDVRGEYCWYGSRGWTFPPIFR